MSEHPHVTLIRRGYAAFSAGDTTTLTELIAPDAVQHVAGDNTVSGDYKGIDAILGYYGRLAEETGGSFHVDLENLYTNGTGRVISVHHITATRGDRTYDGRGCLVFDIVNDRVISIDASEEDLDAVNRFWA